MMPESDLTLKLREHFAALQGRAEGQECPTADKFWAALHGELPPEDIGLLIDHTIACAECAESWRLTRELSRPVDDPAPVTVREFPAKRSPKWRTWGGAALATAAVLTLLVVSPQILQQNQDSTVRGTLQDSPASALESLVEADLPRENCELKWTPGPEGSVYEVTVRNAEDSALLSKGRNLKKAEYLVPLEDLSAVPSGGEMNWFVEMITPQGDHSISETHSSRLK